MDEIVAAKDRAALLRQGIALVAAELKGGRLIVEVTGAPDERVRAAVAERLGSSTRITVVDDLPRRLYARPCVGHMEREEGRLQVRYVLWPDEHLGDVIVVEDEESVVVLGLICVSAVYEAGEACEHPYHVYLDQPLGDRKVYDGFSGEEVPYKNVWLRVQERIDDEGWPRADDGDALDGEPPEGRSPNAEERVMEMLRGDTRAEWAETRRADGG
jgi:hypothetical protein